MHLAQLHSPQSSKESSSSSFIASAAAAATKNMFAAFLVGIVLGLVLASSFFSISPHQFHTDVQLSHVEELTAKLMNLPPAQKRRVLQQVFSAKYASKSFNNNNQQQKLLSDSSSGTNNEENLALGKKFLGTESEWKKNKKFFPLFEPVAKKPVAIQNFITRSRWAEVDVRLVEKDFGLSALKINNKVSSSSSLMTTTKQTKKSNLLPWTWVNVRPHINALPVLTKSEVLAIWHSPSLLKKISTARSFSVITSKPSEHTTTHLFPVWLQTKYGYRGDSVAVVGGLFEPTTDKSLRQTAIRELREELGIVCETVVSHGRFVNDGNRGCGNFESFYAKNCKKTEQTKDDKAAADTESQQLMLFTREDLIETLKNTRELSKNTEFPYSSDDDAYDDVKYSSKTVQGKYYRDGGKDREDLEKAAGGAHSLSHEFVLKETKWISTISMTLLALENEK